MARCTRLRDRERREQSRNQKKNTSPPPPNEVGESGQLHGTNEKVEMKTAANRLWNWGFHSEPFQALHHPCLCLPAGMEDVITVRRGVIRRAIFVLFFLVSGVP